MYRNLLPFADAVVTCAPDADGRLVATIAKGEARKPGCMLVAPVRHFHSILIVAIAVAYLLYGWPRWQDCEVGVVGARVFLVLLLVVANGALY